MKKIAGWGLLLLFADILGISIFAFIGVIFSDDVARFVGELLGTRTEKDAFGFLGWIISGLAGLFYGLLILSRWVAAQKKGLIQYRFKAAIEVVVKKLDFLHLLLGVLIILVIAFFTVMGSDGFSNFLGKLFGIKTHEGKKETLQFLGWIISGFAGLFGLLILSKRVAAQEKGLIQDRFKAAIDHLSNERTSARIASFHELFYLAKDVPDYTETILGILCAHLRHTRNAKDAKQELMESQTLVNILFSSTAKKIFEKFDYDLQRAQLIKVDFRKMHKPKGKVDFSYANLSEACFDETDISGFVFRETELREAGFSEADLQNADLFAADLSNAQLFKANLSYAYLLAANMSEVLLVKTNFSGACLSGADLLGASFGKTNFSDADLSDADLSDANLSDAYLAGADLSGAYLSNAKGLESAKLSGAQYGKALDRRDTQFPKGFNPEDHGMEYIPSNDEDYYDL